MKPYFILFLFGIILAACENPEFEFDSSNYQPKLVIEAYLVPGQSPTDIKVTRNFPLAQSISLEDVILSDAIVRITRNSDQQHINLVYNAEKGNYEYPGSDFTIGYDEDYQLYVEAAIDGKTLSAKSTTHTPKPGFKILPESSQLAQTSYTGSENFMLAFSPSPGTDFYVASLTALDASVESFIYSPENRYETLELEDSSTVREELNFRKYNSSAWLNVPDSVSQIHELEWYLFDFYGRYKIILYAMDKNAKDFYLTHKEVQEMDGNFVEPRMAIDGEGIGVFGSVLADTVEVVVIN